MTIIGIGCDVAEMARVARACRRSGEPFVKRLLSEEELDQWRALPPARRTGYVAARLALKESLVKAMGGMAPGMTYRDMVALDTETGIVWQLKKQVACWGKTAGAGRIVAGASVAGGLVLATLVVEAR